MSQSFYEKINLLHFVQYESEHVMGTDQLRGNREADQRLCVCYTDSTIPLLSEFEISSL